MGDGSVVTWGTSSFGGDSEDVAKQLKSGVRSISAVAWAFAALKDSSVVTWGSSSFSQYSRAVMRDIARDVQSISATGSAFAASKGNGAVWTWGFPGSGGNSSAVREQLAA